MAPAGPRMQKPVGSSAWISTEKENFMQLVDQEMEEIEYPVRHEMDWLNEHMAEVFASSQFNLTDVFKTPGKLRGKTPRTIRKRNIDENRIPLSEIFTSAHNYGDLSRTTSPARSPVKPTAIPHATTPLEAKASPLKIKDTTEDTAQPRYPDLARNLNSFPQYNTDSGYHGMPEDEEEDEEEDNDDDMVLTQVQTETQTSTQPLEDKSTTVESQAHCPSVDRRTTAASFHSAQEDVRQREETVEPMESAETEPVNHNGTTPKLEKVPSPAPEPKEKEPEVAVVSEAAPEDEPEPQPETRSSPVKISAAEQFAQDEPNEKDETALDNLDDIGSPSDNSTPERPPIRKSSLTFASLPAREPLLKNSLGGSRISRTSHIDIAKLNSAGSSGFLGRQTGGHKTASLGEDPAHDDNMDTDEDMESAHPQDEETDADTRASKLHNKSSTQRLHEKISMLGKLQPSRPTKSIPSVSGLSSAQVAYPELPATNSKSDVPSQESRVTAPEPMAIDGDGWIKPIDSPRKVNSPRRHHTDIQEKESGAEAGRTYGGERNSVPQAHVGNDGVAPRPSTRTVAESIREKSATPAYSSPQRPGHQKSASVSNTTYYGSTTPVVSPIAERHDGPLSASKLKLQSIMRSAKGLFTNTGSVTAAARVEASSPDELRLHSYNRPKSSAARESQNRRPLQVSSPPRQEGRRTRSSTEREEKRKQKELEDRRREEEAERAREEERQKALQLKIAQERARLEEEERKAAAAAAAAAAASPKKAPLFQRHQSREAEPSHEVVPRAPSRMSVSQQQPKQNDRRPVKPTREVLQKPKPQPVSIRVGSALSRQIPLASTSVASGGQEASAPIVSPVSASKPPTLKKKASSSSLHTASSNSSFKSSISSQSQRKAQLANERKREQEEREARRREEQRREMERKRAAQHSRAEAERRERLAVEDPKKAAQMQAIEKRRQENARRLERQGNQQPSTERASILQPERPLSQAARPASRLGSIQPFNRTINPPQPNPAKPPKRGLDEEAGYRPATLKPSTAQLSGESKRRKTEDEHNPPMSSIRPTMAPPIRQSGIRKESVKPSIFSHGQTSTHQAGPSIFKTAQPQRPAHPMDMARYANGKIPFAEPSKTPGASSSHKAPAKPSPNYPNGENIHLPEIATDSEDEDSDSGMLPVPKWAQPKELENILRQQEGMEADSIFGPIAPFSLEETFKADKKVKKYRERTSSANWSGADGLTQDEIRRDLAERQRLRLNGGWTFGT